MEEVGNGKKVVPTPTTPFHFSTKFYHITNLLRSCLSTERNESDRERMYFGLLEI